MRLTAPCHWPAEQYRRGWSTSPRHSGVDFGWRAAPNTAKSKEVLAAAPGIVESATDSGAHNQGWGNRIVIRHTDRATTTYSHNQSGTAKVKARNVVKAGQVLATQGATGDAQGTHLHFEVYIDGVRVNPQPYLDGKPLPGTPVIPTNPNSRTFRNANLRTGKYVSAPVATTLVNETLDVIEWQHGGDVAGNDVWFRVQSPRAGQGIGWCHSSTATDPSTKGIRDGNPVEPTPAPAPEPVLPEIPGSEPVPDPVIPEEKPMSGPQPTLPPRVESSGIVSGLGAIIRSQSARLKVYGVATIVALSIYVLSDVRDAVVQSLAAGNDPVKVGIDGALAGIGLLIIPLGMLAVANVTDPKAEA